MDSSSKGVVETSVPVSPFVFFDGRFAFNRVNGMFFSLSEEAALILQAVWDRHGADEIKDMMIARFGIDRGTAIRDTQQFLAKLRDLDLLPPNGNVGS
jgi:hypothetical protein